MKYSHEDGFVIVDQGGNPYLGGNDVDITLLEFIEQQYRNQYGTELIKKSKQALRKRSALKEKSEEIKLALFTQQCTDFDTSPFTGDELSIPVTQASFNRLIDPIVDKTLECVKLLLQRNHLQPGNISYFFMIGGSSQLTLVAEKTKKLFRDCIFPQVNRQQCVANGAALMLLADYSGNRQTVKEIMSESIGLGIGEGKVLIMLKKGGKLPLTGKSYLFKTTLDNQKQVDMKIFKYNGDLKRDEPVNMIDEAVCRYIYDLNFVLPEVRPKGEYYIEIELSMEVGGVLTVTCYDPTSGRSTIYTQEYEAVYGSYFLVCFQSFFSFFFSINCLISRVPIVFTISTVTTFTLHLSFFLLFQMNSLLIFFIFSLGKTLDLNFSYSVVASECSDEKHYAKVIKVSGSRGNKETFTISGTINGMETILVTGAAVPANQNSTNEYCLDPTDDGLYKVNLLQT